MVSLGATAGAFFSVMKDAETALLGMADSSKITQASMDRLATTLSVGTVAAVGVFAAESIKSATDFQTAMTHLVTAADLPKSAVQDLGNQFLDLSTKVATSATDLANASYYVLSEGYNWQGTANIMHTAAQLSIEDQTDLTSATRALVTTMHDYGASSDQATNYGNAFREMLALSGTNMQSLSENMGRVDQMAHALGMDFSQTAGALATLTKEGMDGAQAETLLSTAMGHLAGDTPKMTKELEGLGIDVQQFQERLSSPDGLVGAITMVTDAIKNHLGQDGLVYLQTALTKPKGNVDAFAQAMGTAPKDIQSYVAALGDAMGGTRNLGVILGLTGPNFDTFKSNVQSVSNALKTGGTDVTGWSDSSATLSVKTKQLGADFDDLKIRLGNGLLPAVDSIVGGLDKFAQYLDKNKTAADAFGIALGVLAAGAMANLALKIGALIGNIGTLGLSLLSGISTMGNFVIMLSVTLYNALATATVAIARFAFAWAVIGWDAIVTGLSGIGTALTTTVVPGLISATSASWSFTASLLANPMTWFVALIVFGIAYVIFWIWAFANNWHGVTALVAGYMADIVIWIVNAWTTIVNFLASTAATITSLLTSLWANIVSGVVSFGTTLYDTFIQPFVRVLGYLGGVIGDFENAGRQLMMGLVHGIESAVSAVISAVTGAVSSAYHAALSFLGINSPSRLFSEDVGVPIVQGIAAGIQGSGSLVSNAVQSAVNPANMGLSGTGSFSGSFGGMGRLGTGGGTTEVHYHLEVGGSIFGLGGMTEVAEQLWQQFLRMQARGTLGLSGSLTIGG